MEKRGLALPAGGGEGRDRGAGTTEEGRTVETQGRDPRRGAGPAPRRVGLSLTSQLARKPVGVGLADGRPEEFAAGGRVGCERVPFSSQRGEAWSNSLAVAMATDLGQGDQRPPSRHWDIPSVLWDSISPRSA